MPTFSKEDLLNMETAGEMETQYSPVPEGEYTAAIKSVEARMVGQDKDKPVFDLLWTIVDSPAAVQATGQDEPIVRQSLFLDTDESGRLQMGKNKNVQLGRVREAVRQNGPERWNVNMLVGQRAKIRVGHRAGQNQGEVFSEVKAVTILR